MRASVCMATYNGALYLREQIDSIVSQLQPGDELLVSDDGSDDDTLQILSGYGSSLTVVGSTRVGGVVRNFERVMGSATGDIVVLADQDDVWLPGKLERLRAELQRCDLVMSNAVVVDAGLAVIAPSLFAQLGASAGLLKNGWRNSFVGCCMGFRADLLQWALPFPMGTPWHDWLLGLLATASGSVCFVDEPLMLYRRHGANVSLTGARSRNSLLNKFALRAQVARALFTIMLRPRFGERVVPDV